MKPLNSPLPPVPLRSEPTTTLITRRPVAGGSLPSPSDSAPLSSVLSAYSNRSSDSTMGSSTDGTTMSAHNSFLHTSPKQGNGGGKASYDELFLPPISPLVMDNYVHSPEPTGLWKDRGQPPPPPPPKNSSAHDQRPQTPPDVPGQSMHAAPSLAQTPPSKPQIWRRRSPKVDKDLAVSELKLVSSHGSTALSTLPPSHSPASTSDSDPRREHFHLEQSEPAATTRVQPRPSPNAAFPGRNIRPVASRQRMSPQTPESMDQEASNLKLVDENASPTKDGSEMTVPSFPGIPNRKQSAPDVKRPPHVTRLPTPEYCHDDVRSPIMETVISPVSPTSSPEPLDETKLITTPKDVRPIHLSVAKEIRPVKSMPILGLDTNGLTLKAKPSSPAGLTVRSPIGLPSSPAPSRGLTPNQSRFPARTSSKPAEDQGPSAVVSERELAVDRAESRAVEFQVPDEAGNARSVGLSQTQSASAAVSETVTPSTKADSRDNADLARPESLASEDPKTESVSTPTSDSFPIGWGEPIPEGNIFDAPPIIERNFRCLANHRIMVQSRNTFYPLACQACHVKDTSIRFTCGTCWLRTCMTCRNNLYRFNNDLQALMKHNEAVLVEHVEEAQDEDKIEGPVSRISAGQLAGAGQVAA